MSCVIKHLPELNNAVIALSKINDSINNLEKQYFMRYDNSYIGHVNRIKDVFESFVLKNTKCDNLPNTVFFEVVCSPVEQSIEKSIQFETLPNRYISYHVPSGVEYTDVSAKQFIITEIKYICSKISEILNQLNIEINTDKCYRCCQEEITEIKEIISEFYNFIETIQYDLK